MIRPSRGLFDLDLANVWAYRELWLTLVRRDIQVLYKQAALGAAWAVIQPVFAVVVFTVVFGNFAKIPSDGIPYPIFAFAAVLPWTYFAEATRRSSTGLVDDADLIRKVCFPRLIMPLAKVTAPLLDFCIAFCVLLVLMAFYGVMPTFKLLAIVALILLASLMALAIGLWLGPINVRFRDIMFSIRTMCERVIDLRKGRVVFDGPTDEGLRLYEQDARLKQVSWFKGSEEKSPVTITAFKRLDDQSRECALFEHGQRMRIRIEYDATREFIQPDVRVSIDRGDDVCCLTYSSMSDQADIPSVIGKGVIELRTAPIMRVSELYTINRSVREKGYGRTLTAQRGDSFQVRHPLYTAAFGVYHEAAQWAFPTTAQRPIPLIANERS